MTDVTNILGQIEDGDSSAAEKLLPLVYEELRKLATARMANERSDHTLQATALVHEAYMRLVDTDTAQKWDSRGHFFAAAAEAMRRILVENARRKYSLKRGGDRDRIDVDFEEVASAEASVEILAVDEALSRLTLENPPVARLVELRYFAGLSVDEAANILEVTPRTAHRYWAYARAWLHREVRFAGGDTTSRLS